MKFFSATVGIMLAASAISAHAEATHTNRLAFPKGRSQTMAAGHVTGRDTIVYKLNAKAGQMLKVSMETDKESADFNIYIPGRGPGDAALFTSATGGRSYTGQLYKTGDHSITVFLNRNAARQGLTAGYKLHVSVTGKASPPTPREEKPATGPVPQRVIDDCLATLRRHIPDRGMKVISSKRGETSFIIDVKVDGVPKPWRCFHDGTKCTGTEYQGEG
ncbi:MAG: hypothetical protein ACKV19_18665 [Verrucomicrobiales bacterium]